MSEYETGRPTNVADRRAPSHAQLVAVLQQMYDDYNGSGASEWENNTLAHYLEALVALAEALPHVYANRGEAMPEQPTWEMFALLLTGATGYE